VFCCLSDCGDYRKYFFVCERLTWIGRVKCVAFFVEVGLFPNSSVCPIRGSIVFSFSHSLDGVGHPC
jgi:hypothetical protein